MTIQSFPKSNKFVTSCNQGRKYRDISAIYRRISCIEGYRHDISWRNIGPAIFQINLKKSDISRDKLAIFPDISHGQRGSTEVKRTTMKSMCYSVVTVPPPPLLLPRGFEPQTFCPLVIWANLPLLYNVH